MIVTDCGGCADDSDRLGKSSSIDIGVLYSPKEFCIHPKMSSLQMVF